MIRKTVGVAPGSYTLQLNQLGAPQYAPNGWQMQRPQVPCPPDENGTGAWGTPTWDWYGYSLPPLPPPTVITQGPPSTQTEAPLLDPYGTQSTLKGPSYGARYHDMMRRKQALARMGFKGLAGLGAVPAWQTQVVNSIKNGNTGSIATTAIQNAVPSYTGVPPSAGLPPAALSTLVDATPWWQQWYVLGPVLLAVAYFGWKKLGHQHAAAVAASPPMPASTTP